MSRKRNLWSLAASLLALSLILAACGSDDAPAEEPEAAPAEEPADEPAEEPAEPAELIEVEILTFNPPSLGAFLPAVIEAQNIDANHGLDVTFVGRPPDAYNTEFAAGQFQVGGSASLMSESNRQLQGVDIVYLFNVHDYWGGLVAVNPEITSLEDIEGRNVAASTSTTTFAMFRWFAHAAGVDLDLVTLENSAPAGLVTLAQTGRTDAVQMAEPAYSQLMYQDIEGLTDIPLPLHLWEEEFGSDDVPFLGVGAHREWAEANTDVIPLLRAMYEEAAEWALANPDEAAEIIASTIEGGEPEPIAELLRNNDRLGLNVRSAADVADGIRAVFEAGMQIGYFEERPSDDLIYMGEL